MTRRTFATAGIIVVSLLLIAGVGGLLYYRSFRTTPQYSLALLIDAARRDDAADFDKLINTDEVVDDFVPQITGKAIELYGRGLPPVTVDRVRALAAPLMPAVKQRARAELPKVIRTRTERFANVPFFAMVLGADRYLDIKVDGDFAIVNSKLENRPLKLKMHRTGDRWQITGVSDEKLATDIARKIGQELIAAAVNGTKKAAQDFGVGNLSDLIRQAEELLQ